MDNNKKGRKYFKNLQSSICKNSGCCGCNSLKKKSTKKILIWKKLIMKLYQKSKKLVN